MCFFTLFCRDHSNGDADRVLMRCVDEVVAINKLSCAMRADTLRISSLPSSCMRLDFLTESLLRAQSEPLRVASSFEGPHAVF